MSQTKVTIREAAELCARLINGQSKKQIQREMGFDPGISQRAMEVLRTNGVTVTRVPAAPADKTRAARFEVLFRTTDLSSGEIARRDGCCVETVSYHRKRYNAGVLARGGVLPICPCGKLMHHFSTCYVRRRAAQPGHLDALSREAREELKILLLGGHRTHKSLAEQFGVSTCAIGKFCARLSADDKEVRRQAQLLPADRRRAREIMGGDADPVKRRTKIELEYARVGRAIPGWRDASLRDDDLQDAMLAMLEGKLDQSNLKAGVRKIVKENDKRFSNPWGNLSLDVAIGHDTDMSYLDMLEDPAALEAFNMIGAEDE